MDFRGSWCYFVSTTVLLITQREILLFLRLYFCSGRVLGIGAKPEPRRKSVLASHISLSTGIDTENTNDPRSRRPPPPLRRRRPPARPGPRETHPRALQLKGDFNGARPCRYPVTRYPVIPFYARKTKERASQLQGESQSQKECNELNAYADPSAGALGCWPAAPPAVCRPCLLRAHASPSCLPACAALCIEYMIDPWWQVNELQLE